MAQHRTKSIVTAVSDDSTYINPTTISGQIPGNYQISLWGNDTHSIITSEIIEDFFIVCFTSNNALPTTDLDYFVDQLKKVTSSIECFKDANQCVDFLTDVADKRILIIMYACPEEGLVSLFGDIPQVCSVYMFETSVTPNRLLQDKVKKFRGVHHDVEEICQSIQTDIHRQWFDSTPLSIISANSPGDLNDLDSSFMYTQLLREVIVEMEYDARKARGDFVTYCRQHLSPLDYSPAELDRFEESYAHHSPIWWYTKEPFIYSNLNRALRTQDTELIMKMGFYIQDVYHEAEQRKSQSQIDSKMIVYRGQGLSDQDFEKLRRSKGALLSFNNFLSTSRDREVSMVFAEDVRDNINLVGILFELEIDPLVSSSTFLLLEDLSEFPEEQEIFFLMHSVFRIVDLTEIDDRLWKVNLILTNENDQELNRITHFFRDEIRSEHGWDRMALLMERLGKLDKALEIHISTLERTIDDDQEALEFARARLMLITGGSHLTMGKYSSSISDVEEALEIMGRYLPANHFVFAQIYGLIGTAQSQIGDNALALSSLDKALEILQQSSSRPQSSEAFIYNSMGSVHYTMGNYQIALLHFEKTRDIQRSFLPRYHPDLIRSCNNIAVSHQWMGNYSKALEYYRETLITGQKSLPLDHPFWGIIYSNVGSIHLQMQDYPSSLEYLEKALHNRQKSYTTDHPDLIVTYWNMGLANRAMNNFSTAFSNFDKALDIQQRSFSSDHPNTAAIHVNLGITHLSKGDYSAALSHLETALEIQKKSLSMDHPQLALIYANIGSTHVALENPQLALPYFEKALDIQRKKLPPHHPDLAKTLRNLAASQIATGNYLPGLSTMNSAIQSEQALMMSENQSVDARLLGAASSDAQFLQNQSMTITEATQSIELNQRMRSLSQVGSVTPEVMLESLDKSLSILEHAENSLRVRPKSVLFDRQVYGMNCDRSSTGNQSVEEIQSELADQRKVFMRVKESAEKLMMNTPDDNQNIEEDFDPMEDLSNLLISCQRVLRARRMPAAQQAMHFNNIGIQSCAVFQYPGALLCFEKALETLTDSVSANSELVAKTHDNMATALDGLERVEEAIYSAEQAVSTASSALGPDHPDARAYRNHQEQLLRKLQFL